MTEKTIEVSRPCGLPLQAGGGGVFRSLHLGLYLRRWVDWVNAGLKKYKSDCETGNITKTSLWIHRRRLLRINKPMALWFSVEGLASLATTHISYAAYIQRLQIQVLYYKYRQNK